MKTTITFIILMNIGFTGLSQLQKEKNQQSNVQQMNQADDIYIMAFPNPSRGLIQLNRQVKSIVAYNFDGQRVSYRKNNDQIDLSHLKKGTYILEVNQSKTMVVNINPQQ